MYTCYIIILSHGKSRFLPNGPVYDQNQIAGAVNFEQGEKQILKMFCKQFHFLKKPIFYNSAESRSFILNANKQAQLNL